MKIGDFVIVRMSYTDARYLVKVTNINADGINGRFARDLDGKWHSVGTTGLFMWKDMLSFKVSKIKLNSI
jgi:hypothetical protein